MEAIVLLLHLCTLSDSLLGFENCKPMIVPQPALKTCQEAAKGFNGASKAKLPRFWRREADKIGTVVLMAPAHCEKDWHPTRNPRSQSIYTTPLGSDYSNPNPQPCDNKGPYCELPKEQDANLHGHLDKTSI